MSEMTLAQIRTQVQGMLDIAENDIPNSVLDTFIAQGFDAIVYSEKRWPFFEVSTTFSTVADQSDYALADIGTTPSTGMREIFSLRTDTGICDYIGRDLGDHRNPLDSLGSGSPTQWTYWGDKIRFYPTPSSVETIYVRGVRNATDFPSTMDGAPNTAAVPDLPAPFHPLLATYAASRAYLQQEDPTMGAQYDRQFQIELDNLARRFADTPAPQPMMLNSRRRDLVDMRYPKRYQNTGGVIF